MSALAINDIVGWLLFTFILGLFAQQVIVLDRIFVILVLVLAFTTAAFSIGRFATDKALVLIKRLDMPQPGAALTFICILGALCGALTQRMGVHALFGFFIAGIMAGSSKALSENVRNVITQMVYALFVPVFFVNVGLKVDLVKSFDWPLVLLLTVIGLLGRYAGAWVGSAIADVPRSDRDAVSIAHTPGGVMQIVVGLLALESGLITEKVFVAIIVSAIVSSMTIGPWLAASLRRRKAVPEVASFIGGHGIVVSIGADSRDQAIRELSQCAGRDLPQFEAESIANAVLNREREMGTGLGNEVAVPHARMAGLERPYIAFGRSLEGIDWDAPDGKLAHFIFLILTPEKDYDAQIEILSSIARLMSDEGMRKGIMNAKNDVELRKLLVSGFRSVEKQRKGKR